MTKPRSSIKELQRQLRREKGIFVSKRVPKRKLSKEQLRKISNIKSTIALRKSLKRFRKLNVKETKRRKRYEERFEPLKREITREIKLREPWEETDTRYVKYGEAFQLRILGLFENEKSYKRKVQEGFSKTHEKVNYEKMLDEACDFCRRELGGTNWKLFKIYKSQIIKWSNKGKKVSLWDG